MTLSEFLARIRETDNKDKFLHEVFTTEADYASALLWRDAIAAESGYCLRGKCYLISEAYDNLVDDVDSDLEQFYNDNKNQLPQVLLL